MCENVDRFHDNVSSSAGPKITGHQIVASPRSRYTLVKLKTSQHWKI